MYKVSVILTTYNSQSFLQRALDSVFIQDGINTSFTLELLVVDDCSTDKTPKILDENKIVYQSTEKNSGGPNTGRNIGLTKATGDYIVIMDHDDEWHPNRILTQLQYAENAPIITCAHKLIQDGKETRDSDKDFEFRIYEKDVTFRDIISRAKKRQSTYLGGVMFHKSLKDIRFEECFGQIDFDWLARLFHNNPSVEVGPSLYNRYVFGENLSLDRTYRIRDYYFSLMTLEAFEKDYPREVIKGRKRINGTFARYHYLMNEMKSARRYFMKSKWNMKTILFLVTSFAGHHYVRKKFHFFG